MELLQHRALERQIGLGPAPRLNDHPGQLASRVIGLIEASAARTGHSPSSRFRPRATTSVSVVTRDFRIGFEGSR